MEKLNSTEAQVVVQVKELEAGYSCINEALNSTQELRNLMQTLYDMLVKAKGMVDNLSHLFEDFDTRSTAIQKSAKERTLELAMEIDAITSPCVVLLRILLPTPSMTMRSVASLEVDCLEVDCPCAAAASILNN